MRPVIVHRVCITLVSLSHKTKVIFGYVQTKVVQIKEKNTFEKHQVICSTHLKIIPMDYITGTFKRAAKDRDKMSLLEALGMRTGIFLVKVRSMWTPRYL